MQGRDAIRDAVPNALRRVDLPASVGERVEGKVRDIFRRGEELVLVTTDRVSAFDRVLGAIPFKGQVLNQLSAFFFERSRDIVENHLVEVPDPNVTIARAARPLPVEVVVRGYITGVTSTSLWTLYERGVERPYGLDLPPGLKKNDPLPRPVITPTTKAEAGVHDERLTPDEILERGLVPAPLWRRVEEVSLALFDLGRRLAERAGLVLVDTKYEFGLVDGRLVLMDEVHTPDSSRYWSRESYDAARGGAGSGALEHFDKEHLRLWFAREGYRGEGDPPAIPVEVVVEVARRYIEVYERMTGSPLEPAPGPAEARIRDALARVLSRRS